MALRTAAYPLHDVGVVANVESQVQILSLPSFPISGQFRTGLSCLQKFSGTGEEDHEAEAIYRRADYLCAAPGGRWDTGGGRVPAARGE